MAPASGGSLILIDVKTGTRPQFTPNQTIVYRMAQIGWHVMSTDSKIEELGFKRGELLPPMDFVVIYKKDENSPYLSWKYKDPIVP